MMSGQWQGGRASSTRAQRGFSLIELMIAMLLSLVLLAGVTTLVVSMSRTHNDMQGKSELFDNGRYATTYIADDIRHAGFYGSYGNVSMDPSLSSLPDPCATSAATIETHLGLALQGYDNPSDASSVSCLASANHVSGTDILVTRRAARDATAVDSLTDGAIYIQGGPTGYVLAAAEGTTSDDEATFDLDDRDGDRIPVRRFRVAIYFISPCREIASSSSTCDGSADDGDPIPTLKRLMLTDDGAGNAVFEREPLTGGIERLQVDYGIDGNDDGQPDEASTATAYVTDPGSIANWGDVVTVRVYALARSIAEVTGHNDDRTYELGRDGFTDQANDAYMRHLFSRTARVVNRSGRRETN